MSIHTRRADVVWNYLGIGLSLGMNVIWLPLLLHYLTPDRLGIWQLFIGIGAVVTLFDFGFTPQLARAFTYAWSGVEQLRTRGIQTAPEGASPNYPLLAAVLRTCRYLYLSIALTALAIMLVGGSLYLQHVIPDASLYAEVRPAWGVYTVSIFLNLYLGYYMMALRGLGDVAGANQANIYGKLCTLVLGTLALAFGYGLLGLAAVSLVSSAVPRFFARWRLERRYRLRGAFAEHAGERHYAMRQILGVLWYNAWRDGLVSLNAYITGQATVLLCGLYLSLAETGIYSVSVQIIGALTGIAVGMLSACLPAIISGTATHAWEQVQRLVALSMTTLYLLFGIGLAAFVAVGIPLLQLIKESFVIEPAVFALLALHLFLVDRHRLWACLIATTNQLPYTRAFILSGLAGTCAAWIALRAGWGIYGLILPPFLIQSLYNNWYWPLYYQRLLHMNEATLLAKGGKMLIRKLRKRR